MLFAFFKLVLLLWLVACLAAIFAAVPSPLRRKGHPALTVTVADVDGLASRLQQQD